MSPYPNPGNRSSVNSSLEVFFPPWWVGLDRILDWLHQRGIVFTCDDIREEVYTTRRQYLTCHRFAWVVLVRLPANET